MESKKKNKNKNKTVNCLFIVAALSCAKLNTLKTLNLNTPLIRNTELIQTQYKNEAVDWLLQGKHSRTELNSGLERNKSNNFFERDTNTELSGTDQSATLPPRWKTGNSGYHNITVHSGLSGDPGSRYWRVKEWAIGCVPAEESNLRDWSVKGNKRYQSRLSNCYLATLLKTHHFKINRFKNSFIIFSCLKATKL